MEFLDARRLTGPSLLWDKPGSILDISCTAAESEQLITVWEQHVRRMLHAVGWSRESTCHWRLSGGVSLAFSAPIDVLYAASAINEWAWACCESDLTGTDMPDFDTAIAAISAAIEEEVNPPLLRLEEAAAAHGVSFLWDDDDVSVGLGNGSETWPFRELPDPDTLDWDRYHDIPHGLVTGTQLTVRRKPDLKSILIGWLRRGEMVRLKPDPHKTATCSSGWYLVHPKGHVCAGQST